MELLGGREGEREGGTERERVDGNIYIHVIVLCNKMYMKSSLKFHQEMYIIYTYMSVYIYMIVYKRLD